MIQLKKSRFTGLDISMAKCRPKTHPRKTRKNDQFYITVCFFYLASDLLSAVQQCDGKTDLRLPQAKKKNFDIRHQSEHFEYEMNRHKYHQRRISKYLSI